MNEPTHSELRGEYAALVHNIEAILEGVPKEYRSNIIVDDKPATLQSLALTVKHLVSLANDRKTFGNLVLAGLERERTMGTMIAGMCLPREE